MTLNKREKFMLWKLLEFSITRYLFTFDKGRQRSGAERAERHMEMSKLIWEVQNCQTATGEDFKKWMRVHDLIAEKISNDLPKTIGYDLDAEEHDWDILTDRFFERLLKLDPSKL